MASMAVLAGQCGDHAEAESLNRKAAKALAECRAYPDLAIVLGNLSAAVADAEEASRVLAQAAWLGLTLRLPDAGETMLGQKIYARLSEIPEPIDMVDIFRASQYALSIVQEALSLKPRPQMIWMQLGIRNDEAAALAEANGMKVVMNRCPKIEHSRLAGTIEWHGIASGVITSKMRAL